VTDGHAGGDGVRVDDDVRGDSLAREQHVLLSKERSYIFFQIKYTLTVRETGGQVGSASAFYGSTTLGSKPDISQKYKMGDISKVVANVL
jgi:hypothetical protein